MWSICLPRPDEYMQDDDVSRVYFLESLRAGSTANSYKTWIVLDIAMTSVSLVGFTYCDASR